MDVPIYTDPLFQAAALALFDAGGTTRESLGPALLVWFDVSHVAMLYDAPSYDPRKLAASSASLWSLQVETINVVLVGGDRERFDVVRESRPVDVGQRILGVTWITPGGAIEVDRSSRHVVDALRAALAGQVPPLRDRDVVAAKLDEAIRKGRTQSEELAAFQGQLAGRKARVTHGLLAAMGALFALKLAIGEHAFAVGVRMGALVPRMVVAEPWRLLSHAFLHSNAVHLLFNSVSLLSLGSFYERLLGPRRFMTLFVVSAISGGVAVCLAAPNVPVVGASGAICGLLGVSAALALRPGTLLPAAVQAGFRRNAAINLFLLLGVSRIPNVSWQAHLGGGLAGFALMMSGVLRPRENGPQRSWDVAGALSFMLSLAAVIMALAFGQPWELRRPPPLQPYTLNATSVTLSLPQRPHLEASGAHREFLAGDLGVDGYAVGVQVAAMIEPVPREGLASTAEEIKNSLGVLGHPANSTALGPIRVKSIAGYPTLAQDFQMVNGFVFEHRLVVRSSVSVSVQVLRQANDERAATLCERIAASVRER